MRNRQALIGAGGIGLLVLGGFVLSLYLGGSFRPAYRVDAIFSRAGQNLRDGSDVKLRGVLVGRVDRTEVTPEGKARVVMAMFPDQRIPDNVTAAIRAKTLFGEKFVELRVPGAPSGGFLRDGDVIDESRTVGPFEVEEVLVRAVPLLRAVDPQQLAAALRAAAEGLVGNEEALRRATVQGEAVLTQTERTLPNLEHDLAHLERFARALQASDEDFLRAFAGLTRAGEALVGGQEDLRALLDRLGPLTRDLADVVTGRERDLADLSAQGAPVLETVAARAPDLPAVAKLLDGFLASWVADLSVGPYWRIFIANPSLTCNASTRCGPYGPGNPPPAPAASLARAQAVGQLTGTLPGEPERGLADLLFGAVPLPEL